MRLIAKKKKGGTLKPVKVTCRKLYFSRCYSWLITGRIQCSYCHQYPLMYPFKILPPHFKQLNENNNVISITNH
jgi:hypothetical protein